MLRRLILLGLGVAVVVVGLAVAYIAFAPTPPDRLPVQTSYLFDANGKRLAAISAGQNRQVVRLADMSPWIRPAVLAAEDRRFYQHRGVDPLGIARALFQDLRHKGRRQGGSTITQQYVKNVYVGRDATFARKIKEAAIAVKIERRLTKDEILERYLNTIYFGRGAYGIEAAARAYFARSSSTLDLAQSAYLAALIRGPESTDATKDLEKATRRRSSVLLAMVQSKAITEEQRAAAERVPLVGPKGVIARGTGGTDFDVPDVGAQWFVDAVRRELVDRYGEQVVETQGLRVTTTLDLATQRAAYRAAYAKVLPDPSDPSAAVVVLGHDGGVRAMVGGRDWSVSKVNLAVGRGGGGVGRPAGSTFKPFVLAAVLRAGYSLESAFDAPATLTIPAGEQGGADWNVRNFRDESLGTINLIEATRRSVNTVFAQVVTNPAIGPQRVADAARLLGVTSPLADYPSIALGTADVAPLEMADAYLTLANHGERTRPTLITEVRTADGRSLKVVGPERKRVMKTEDADAITAVLREVVRSGTGTAAAVPGMAVAGKTGTTNDSRDAWFVGYTPEQCCVTAVWMGYPDSAKAMTLVHGSKVSGGTLPARIFAATMRVAVPSSVSGARFARVEDFGGRLLPDSTRVTAQLGSAGSSGSGSGSSATAPAATADVTETPVVETTVPVVQAGGGAVETVVPGTDVAISAPTVPPAVAPSPPTAVVVGEPVTSVAPG